MVAEQNGSLFGEVRALLFTSGVIAAATAKSTGVFFGTDVTLAALYLITRGTWTIWVVDSSFIRVARRPCLEDVHRCLKV